MGKSASNSFRNESRGLRVPEVRISVRMLHLTKDWSENPGWKHQRLNSVFVVTFPCNQNFHLEQNTTLRKCNSLLSMFQDVFDVVTKSMTPFSNHRVFIFLSRVETVQSLSKRGKCQIDSCIKFTICIWAKVPSLFLKYLYLNIVLGVYVCNHEGHRSLRNIVPALASLRRESDKSVSSSHEWRPYRLQHRRLDDLKRAATTNQPIKRFETVKLKDLTNILWF